MQFLGKSKIFVDLKLILSVFYLFFVLLYYPRKVLNKKYIRDLRQYQRELSVTSLRKHQFFCDTQKI